MTHLIQALKLLTALSVAILVATSGSITHDMFAFQSQTNQIVTAKDDSGHVFNHRRISCHDGLGLDRRTCAEICAPQILLPAAATVLKRDVERITFAIDPSLARISAGSVKAQLARFELLPGLDGTACAGRRVISASSRYRL